MPNPDTIIIKPSMGLSGKNLFKYLSILEQSLLIQKVLNLSGSFRREKRLLRKLYPASSNFLSLIPEQINTGFKAETYINTLLHSFTKNVYLYHHRNKEIDFILPEKQLAVEVKYQEHIAPYDYRFIESYIKDKGYKGMMITNNYSHTIPGKNLSFVPLEEVEYHLSAM